MTSSRRLSNGRSPLVRKQCQITSFFSPGSHNLEPPAKPSPTPSPLSGPSPVQVEAKEKKPLIIGPTATDCSATPPSVGDKVALSGEVVGKRIRVFWPLDNAWYEGLVRSFDEASCKHSILYDDDEEELLDLKKERIEWVAPRSFRRLRRMLGSVSSAASAPLESGKAEADSSDEACTDEEWVSGAQKDPISDDSDSLELEDEELVTRSTKRRAYNSSKVCSGSAKRRKISMDKIDCIIKTVNFDDQDDNLESRGSASPGRICCVNTVNSPGRNRHLNDGNFSLTDDRFGKRYAEKFKFLGTERMDACRRRPGESDYDPRTLYLPQEFLKSLSGGQRQWWEFKSKHMDKVLFFKMGKFYELFEMDAHVGTRELDLQYMKGEQPHCGFPEKNLSINLEKLARKGYRVLVVEQTETPEQLELRRKEMGAKDKVVKREVCAVVTKGTLVEGETLLTNPDSSYLMSITEKCPDVEHNKQGTVLGVCIVDVSTSKFMLGQFDDNLDRHCLCSMLSELRPVEIIKPCKVLSTETERVLMQNTRNPLVNELIPSSEFWNAEKTISEINKIFGRSGSMDDKICVDLHSMVNGSGILPDILSDLVNATQNGYLALSALGGCLFYLRQAFLDEALLRRGKFEELPCAGAFTKLQKSYMVLDAPALENLEILENRNGNAAGTLYAQLDHCVTASGKRLLKSWLARPLHDIGSIVARQDAISVFKGIGISFAVEFRKVLSKLPDMERLLARLFHSCEAFGRNSSTVILYEDASKRKLQEFLSALRGCQLMVQACSSLASMLTSTDSSLVHHLLTPGKGLPDVSKLVKYFEDAFDWSEAEKSWRIIPNEGCDADYDDICKKVREIESNLMIHLKDQCKLLGCSAINYVTVGKDNYLLEVPESLMSSIPRDYELRSSKKGFFRYWTAEIKNYISELTKAEAEKQSKLQGILLRLIQQFSEHHNKWRQLVSVTSELDVLISLAIAKDYYEGPTCRPVLEEIEDSNDTAFLSAKSLGHPTLLSDNLGKGSFVPNDVSIGGTINPSFILLTGPNMGGKSTLLRQICLAIILAQIGADVPAESFKLSLVDRIFVRMGARDHIMAGQSTFLTELSETASVLSSATQHSFVALDELGRGTSTSDGQAIAGSVLQYLVHTISCRGMFSTHYHHLAADFKKDPKISVCHMACQVGKGIDGVEEVTFLYKLTLGSCPKSYGVNVARLAGVPLSVLQKAMSKSTHFEGVHGNSLTLKDKEMDVLQDLIHLSKTWKCEKSSQVIHLALLQEIQQRAQLLLVES
ncbi:hypothetical protein HPP92_020989 [Vanilla planifolia]|uniref:DNA mismatch repair protein n=3 Tax=Vanilla planifolia TaxID=51239 RepID=A0A835Q4Q1_VANPL|nr:hypothetical protein HPP92_020989 [Vanilla planifolia]